MHRNLKPDNIMVSENGSVIITDFCLSRLTCIPHSCYTPEDPKERERSGREGRRLWYRAPELLFRKQLYAFEVDIWTIGCVLAEIVLSEPLFCGDSEIEQLFKIFQFLGAPKDCTSLGATTETKIDFPKWQIVPLAHASYPHNSIEFKKLCETLIPNREATFQKLIRLSNVLGLEGMKILEAMLSINPQHRPSAQSLLNHPFFNDIKYRSVKLMVEHENISEMWKMFHNNEILYKAKSNYMTLQASINETMRSILIDWLIDVSVHFELSNDTLHLAVVYLDRALSEMIIDKSKLQLLGVTCMKIADVFNEKSKEYYRQENAKEYAFITAEEYTPQDVLETEKKILSLFKFKLLSPGTTHFLKLYGQVLELDEKSKILSDVRIL